MLLEEVREKHELHDRMQLLGGLEHSQVRDVSENICVPFPMSVFSIPIPGSGTGRHISQHVAHRGVLHSNSGGCKLWVSDCMPLYVLHPWCTYSGCTYYLVLHHSHCCSITGFKLSAPRWAESQKSYLLTSLDWPSPLSHVRTIDLECAPVYT